MRVFVQECLYYVVGGVQCADLGLSSPKTVRSSKTCSGEPNNLVSFVTAMPNCASKGCTSAANLSVPSLRSTSDLGIFFFFFFLASFFFFFLACREYAHALG